MTSENGSELATYYTMDEVLTMYGSTWALDSLNFYLCTIVSVIGFVLSILGFVVFSKSEFNIPLYAYLRVFCLTSVAMCSVCIFKFVANSYRILSWSNSFGTQVYFNYVMIPLSNLFYFHSTVLDIVILLDRICLLNIQMKQKMKWLHQYPYRLCAFIFMLCILVDFPYFFVFIPAQATVQLNQTTPFVIHYSSTSPFAASELGKILTFMVYAVRDVAVMVIQFSLNIASAVLLKRHFQKKQKISATSTLQGRSVVSEATTHETAEPSRQSGARKTKKVEFSKLENDTTIMIMIMCVVSFLVHVILLFAIIYPLNNLNLLVFTLYFVTDFNLPLKALIDFFLFYRFNKKFKEGFVNLFKW
jgi:hypothetical protein